MEIDKKISEVSKTNWGGLPYFDMKRELIKLYKIIKWFLEKTHNEYLGRNEKSVLRSLKSDNPPKEFLEVLLEEEKADKNRKRIVEFIENVIR